MITCKKVMSLKELMFIILLVNLVFYRHVAYAQHSSVWHSFTDAKTELTGYKDAGGKIKIPPRFSGFSRALIFRNIIAVTDDRTLKSYYLLKNGKQVGKDSIYVWDMQYDCEQEGKIRFRDPKTDKVGFFGSDGKITIPADYNDARAFCNNMAMVIHNGKRICADGSTYDNQKPCEHWGWDGVTALIDSRGNVIADSLDIDQLQHLNWYSLQIDTKPADTVLRRSFKSKDGHYYSFVDYEKEFKQWLYQQFMIGIQSKRPTGIFDIVSVEGLYKNDLRKVITRKDFTAKYQKALTNKLQRIRKEKIEYFISSQELNRMIYTQPPFKKYYTDCGEANNAKHPLFEIVTTIYGKQKDFSYQEHFTFLRIENGYQLIGIGWKNLQ